MNSYFPQNDDKSNDSAYTSLVIEILDREEFQEDTGSGFTNFSNQEDGRCYHIPHSLDNFSGKRWFSESSTSDLEQKPETSTHFAYEEKPELYPVDEFFALIEKCRINDTPLHISEKQFYTTKNHISVSKSGIELDFDIFQKQSSRVITDADYSSLITEIAEIMSETLDLKSCDDMMESPLRFKTAAVILRKDKITPIAVAGKYKDCYKESFHLRFPGIKVSKGYKKFLIRRIKSEGVLGNIFGRHGFLNVNDNMLDECSAYFPAMLLGSMKRDGKTPHKFHKLFDVIMKPGKSSASATLSHAFDQINLDAPKIKVKDPEYGRRMLSVLPTPEFNYNLAHECSLLYESPGKPYIKKREFKVNRSIKQEIKSMEERLDKINEVTNSTFMTESEYRRIRDAVSDITIVNYDARYLDQLLELINIDHAVDYEKWKKVVRCIALENEHFKPLAEHFSTRCPEKWKSGGEESFDKLWEFYIRTKDSQIDKNSGLRILKMIAREDNQEKYEQLKQNDVFSILGEYVFKRHGDLNENDIANILARMYRDIFVADLNGKDERRWYQFVIPDQSETQPQFQYKWRDEGRVPDALDYIISEKLEAVIDGYINYIQSVKDKAQKDISEISQKSGGDDDKNAATKARIEKLERNYKRHQFVEKNLRQLTKSFGNGAFINRIISRADKIGKFRRRGFIKQLDKDPSVIGVGNGVLKLFPEVKLIQQFHDISISRFTETEYEEYNPDNPYIQELENALQDMFIHPDGTPDKESFEFVMMYHATSLDGNPKEPLFFILNGEGSNGKSVLMELHKTVMGDVTDNGYGNKINMDFFTGAKRSSHGPDSEKMTLEFSRYTYLSESGKDDVIQMERVKEITGGESISGSEKNEKQRVFRVNSIFISGTNNLLRIKGSDHGTWRRILALYMKAKFTNNPDPDVPTQKQGDDKWRNAASNKYYKRAYLSILVKYYQKLQTEFGGKIMSVPHEVIENETREYRKTQDHYGRFMMENTLYVGPRYKNTEELVKPISIEKVANRFREWYSSCIDRNVPSGSTVVEQLKKCSEHFEEIDGKAVYLVRHVLLRAGDNPESSKFSAKKSQETREEDTEIKNEIETSEDFDDFGDIGDSLENLEDVIESPENQSQEEILTDESFSELDFSDISSLELE